MAPCALMWALVTYIILTLGSSAAVVVLFLLCFKTMASWQHCVDYITNNARLSDPGVTLAAQASVGQIPPSTNEEKTQR